MEVYERVAKVGLKKQTKKLKQAKTKQQCVVVHTFSLFSFSQITKAT